jgi:hypothetical protein
MQSTYYYCQILMTLEFLTDFLKISNVMKIHQIGAKCRWTNMTKLIVTLNNFANAPKNRVQDGSEMTYCL